MLRMGEEELTDDQMEQLDDLENAVRELFSIMSKDEYNDPQREDIYDLLEDAQTILEKRNIRAYFPSHIEDAQGRSYTIDFTDEELSDEKSLEDNKKKQKSKGR